MKSVGIRTGWGGTSGVVGTLGTIRSNSLLWYKEITLSNQQIRIGIISYLSLLVLSMLFAFYRIYSKARKSHLEEKRIYVLRIALNDFFSRNGVIGIGRTYAVILAFGLVVIVSVLSIIIGGILPILVVKVLWVISGFVFGYYLLKAIVDTARSIEVEGLKTTIKMGGYKGVISLFIFLMFGTLTS